jgi:putative phosphoesterase
MKLFVTADIHGSVNTWLTVRALMEKSDILVIAGDLFDTRYGTSCHPDFDPVTIRRDLATIGRPLHYVYGNCDEPSFFPGHAHSLSFEANGRTVFLHHGFPRVPTPDDADIIIQGHTHVWSLEKQNQRIFLNPGSLARPRKGPATYGVMDDSHISVRSLDTGTVLKTLTL